MKHHYIIRTVTILIIPIIMIYALYVQFHGEYSPGGGFQAGVLFSSAFIIFDMVFGRDDSKKIITLENVKCIACLGCIIYSAVGLCGIIFGKNFLDYSVFLNDKQLSQQLGVMLVEIGVFFTVFAASYIFYYIFSERL